MKSIIKTGERRHRFKRSSGKTSRLFHLCLGCDERNQQRDVTASHTQEAFRDLVVKDFVILCFSTRSPRDFFLPS